MKNIIAAIVSFIVLFLIMWGSTYWFEIEENSTRKLIITFVGVVSGLGAYFVPCCFMIEKPFKD